MHFCMLLCSDTMEVRRTNREDLNDNLEHLPSTKYTVYIQLSNSIGQKRTDGRIMSLKSSWFGVNRGSRSWRVLTGQEVITDLYWAEEEVCVIWYQAHHDSFLTGSRQCGGEGRWGLEDLCLRWSALVSSTIC